MQKNLTGRERQLLDFLKSYIERYEKPPSSLDIQSHFGFASLSSVYKYLQCLKRKGFIEINKSPSRMISLNLIEKEPQAHFHSYRLPLIGHLNDEGEIEHAPTIQKIPYGTDQRFSSGCFLLKITGGNYLEAGLLPNDLLIIEPRTEALGGEAILAKLYNEEFTIKKYHPKGSYVRLDSFCIQVEPLMVLSEEISIHGVLLGVIRNYSLN